MISVDRALSIYTDYITNCEPFNIESLKEKMTSSDYEEFVELARFIDLVDETNKLSRYQEMFEQLNEYKERIYNIVEVANFRTEKNTTVDEAQTNIDKIFNEEFGDE